MGYLERAVVEVHGAGTKTLRDAQPGGAAFAYGAAACRVSRGGGGSDVWGSRLLLLWGIQRDAKRCITGGSGIGAGGGRDCARLAREEQPERATAVVHGAIRQGNAAQRCSSKREQLWWCMEHPERAVVVVYGTIAVVYVAARPGVGRERGTWVRLHAAAAPLCRLTHMCGRTH